MMSFTPVVLWSDALLFALLAICIAGGIAMRHAEHLRSAWRRVGASRMGMAALTILTGFFLVGLLDSLHYRARLAPPAAGKAEAKYSV